MLLMMSVSVKAQLTAGTYYLYNVGADRYLNYGGSDNYTACLKPHGEPVVLAASGDGFTVQTALDSRYLSATATSENARQTTGTVFTFTQQTDGTYTISSSAGLMGYGGTIASNLAGTTVKMNLSDAASNNARWQLLTKDDLLGRFSEASQSNPVDATFLITCPNFDRHHANLSAWSDYTTGNNTGYLCNNAAYKFDSNKTVQQTISDMPNGIYLLKAQAFYRHGANSTATSYTEASMPMQGYMFAGSDEVLVTSILSSANRSATDIYGSYGRSFGGGYIPYGASNNYAGACIAFDNGLYADNELQTTVLNGSLTIGFKIKTLTQYSWIAYDNIELYYLGPLADLTPFKEQYYALRTTIQEKFIDNTSIYTDGDDATTAYQIVLSTQNDIVENATSEQEIADAKTALWEAALTFMKSVDINDGEGFDLTWMIQDADFSDSNYSKYWTEECNSTNAHGYTSGVLRYYNSPFNVYQKLSYTLPAGAYRMKVDGFERTNDPMNTAWEDYQGDNSVVTGTLYFNDNEHHIMNIFDVQSVTSNSLGGEKPSGASFYVANGSSSANKYLAAGYYPNSFIGVMADDGPITIGYRCANEKAWTAVDNFQFEYIGEVPEVAINVTAGELMAVVAPFTLDINDDAIDELYAIGSERENKILLYSVSTVKPGTPCVAKFNTDTYSAPMEVAIISGKKFVMPWEGGYMTVDAANYTWNYYYLNEEGSTTGADLEKVVIDNDDPNEMRFYVNLENRAVRKYLNMVNYDGASDGSRVAEFNAAPPARRDIPNAVMLPVPPFDADQMEVKVRDNETDETVATTTVLRGESEAYVYNLLPQHGYKYSVNDNEIGNFETVGHLRMIYAPSAYNIRDLGGWETQDGSRTTYGHLFRGSTLNGYVNCTPEDIQALKDLGIGGEIDLRWKSDYDKDMGCGTSAFGFTGDDYYFAAANDYTAANLNESGTQKRLKQEFEFIIDHFRQGKAVYFHCAWGADRTGMLSFLLEGVLGMTIDQIYKNYELTSFSAAPGATNRLKTSFQDRIDVILALDGVTLRDKFENYFLNKLQVPMADITYFRSVMLDLYPLRVDEDADLTGYYDGRADITLHRTLKADMHNTVVLPCDLTLWESQYFFGEGTKIENIVAYEDGVLKTEPITDDTDFAPANKPFLLIPTSVNDDNIYTLHDVPVREGDLTDATFTCGKMVGSYAATCDIAKSTESGKENYVISNDQFYVINATPATMKGTRAYLVLDTPSNGVKSIVSFDGEDGATGIEKVNGQQPTANEVYDLCGRRVAQPTKGMYLINGKKVLVK